MATPEILPAELARAIESGEPMHVLDIRAPIRLATDKIDLVPDDQFYNIVGSRLATMRSPEDIGMDPTVPVAVVCEHGNSSKPATEFLNRLGYTARSMRGGMAAWMQLEVVRTIPPTPSLDELRQFDRIGKGALGYVLVSDGEALVIDPPRNLDDIVATLETVGATLKGVAETHCHADYISGGPALAHRFSVPYYLHPLDAVYPYDGTPGKLQFEPLADGQMLALGRAEVRAVHTPGHTEGHVCYHVDDRAAFTGDFIFILSVGRPDLAGKTKEWTATLWKSLTRATAWPSDLMIYPAHYSSDAERNDDRTIGRSLGDLRIHNPALQLDEQSFTEWVLAKTGSFPEAYRTIKAVNVGLLSVNDLQAEELEVGKNECAVA